MKNLKKEEKKQTPIIRWILYFFCGFMDMVFFSCKPRLSSTHISEYKGRYLVINFGDGSFVQMGPLVGLDKLARVLQEEQTGHVTPDIASLDLFRCRINVQLLQWLHGKHQQVFNTTRSMSPLD